MKSNLKTLFALLIAVVIAFGSVSLGLAANLPATDDNPRVGEGNTMPAWYPVYPTNFTFYHDENAPRVNDDADLFTASEEQELESLILSVRNQLQRDVVIYTTDTSYGLSHKILAADFYDFNGYGYDTEREGFCLLICMETGNRGFYTCGTGSETMSLHTEEVANELDDDLEYYIKRAVNGNGTYYEAVENWVIGIYNLYTKGMTYAPEWQPDRGTSFTRTNNASALRVVDDAQVLTGDQVIKLTSQAKAISDKYGVDVVVHTSRTSYSMYMQEYSDAFYKYNGYGFGSNFDGILLTAFPSTYYDDDADSMQVVMTVSGKAADRMNETKEERLLDHYKSNAAGGRYYEGISDWLSATEHYLKTGRVPRSGMYWVVRTLIASAVGAIFGGITLSGAKKKMRPVRAQVNADYYIDRNQLNIQSLGDNLLYTTTSRTYSPVERSSSSSGGGGRSSYSGSYHGSSGSSHSGSGRSF